MSVAVIFQKEMKSVDRTIPPHIHPVHVPEVPAPETMVLDNGVILHILDGGDQEISTLRLIFSGGTLEADPFFAVPVTIGDVLTKGCLKYDEQQIAEIIDFNGATLGGSSMEHYSGLRLSMLNHTASPVLDMMTEMLNAPTFPGRHVDVSLNMIATNIDIALKRPTTISRRTLAGMVYGTGHPITRSLSVSPDDVRSIDRTMITEFYDRMYSSRGLHAYLSGRVGPEMRARVIEFLNSLSGAPAPMERVYVPGQFQAPGEEVVSMPESLQTSVAIALPAPLRDHPDYHPLRLTVMALGGYFGSRLSANIREEKGLTYGITASLLGQPEGSYIAIAAECDNRYTRRVIDEVVHELVRMSAEPPCGEELERVRLHAVTSMLEQRDTVAGVMDMHVAAHTVGMPADYYAQMARAVADMTPETLAEMSRRYLCPDLMRTALAGNLL